MHSDLQVALTDRNHTLDPLFTPERLRLKKKKKAKKDDDEESEESGEEEVDDDGYQFVEKVGVSKISRIRYMERGRIIHISGLLHRL